MSPLSESDQEQLLRLARRALETGVREGRLPEVEVASPALSEKRGAFVTLHKAGRLRGCIGYVEALKPLCQTVAECAVAAALRDPRFDPVEAEELPLLHLEISALSPFEEISPQEVEVGRHGLMISQGWQRGLLLPQVATEWKWDRERFLEETCLKAGLAADAWRRGARIQAFTAQVFSEPPTATRTSPHAA
jgi:AmmeMemoRadiSam system protein A